MILSKQVSSLPTALKEIRKKSLCCPVRPLLLLPVCSQWTAASWPLLQRGPANRRPKNRDPVEWNVSEGKKRGPVLTFLSSFSSLIVSVLACCVCVCVCVCACVRACVLVWCTGAGEQRLAVRRELQASAFCPEHHKVVVLSLKSEPTLRLSSQKKANAQFVH